MSDAPLVLSADEEAAFQGRIFDELVACRWRHPSGEESLNPLHAAFQIAQGEAEFRRKVRRDWGVASLANPSICGRSDGSRIAVMAWFSIRALLSEWCASVGLLNTGRAVMEGDARGVISFFENHYVPPAPRPRLADEVVTVTESGMGPGGRGAGMVDCWKSSGLKREGTLRELVEDLADPEQRAREHRLLDVYEEKERRALEGSDA